MKVGIHIDRSVEEIEVLITAQERNRKVDALYQEQFQKWVWHIQSAMQK